MDLRLSGKLALVTGSTAGIGYAIAGTGITVNSVMPGPTSLIKRFATTEEVAAMVAYVASPLASATTGAALRVDGGTVKSAF
jgi:NAD(P)-dependent dehydrogenase (short-subunit alcohol dehydrogenase family)